MTVHDQPAQPDKAALYSNQTSRPAMLPPQWDNIPASLATLKQWVAWELRWLPKRACWAKVPLDVRGISATSGYARAKSDTPSTWSDLERVRSAWGRTYGTYTPANPDGPGFVFKAGGGILGIDGDKCRNPATGELTEFGRKLVTTYPGYWEVSPSGTGIKGIFYGTLPEGKGRKVDFADGQGCEIYDRGRYFAITGRRLDEAATDLTSSESWLAGFLAEMFPAKQKRAKKGAGAAALASGGVLAKTDGNTSAVALTLPLNLDLSEKLRRARGYLGTIEGAVAYHGGDNATYRAACKLVIGFDLSPSEAFPLMCEWNQTCSPPWDTDWLWRKLNEADKQPGVRGELLNERQSDTRAQQQQQAEYTAEEVAALIEQFKKELASKAAAFAPDALPEECAIYADDDIRDEMKMSPVTCKNKRPVLMEKDETPFVCDRPCGNGSKCRNCLTDRNYKRTREGNGYILRVSGLLTMSGASNTSDGQPTPILKHYAAILPEHILPATKLWDTLTNRVRDLGGERCSILTDDSEGVATRLGANPEASGFFLKDNKAQGESGSECNRRLWRITLPDGRGDTVTMAGFTFRRITPAQSMRAGFHAFKTVPAAPESGVFKPYHESSGWGDEEEKYPTTVKVLASARFNRKQVARILSESGVDGHDVLFDRHNNSEPGIGWNLTGAQSLAMKIWVRHDKEQFESPSIERVIELARHWIPLLPKGIGQGYRVEKLLQLHIWNLGLYDFTDELIQANEQDQAQEAFTAEANSMLQSLREQYRGREHEASEFVKLLLLA